MDRTRNEDIYGKMIRCSDDENGGMVVEMVWQSPPIKGTTLTFVESQGMFFMFNMLTICRCNRFRNFDSV